jgi:hypothetical protein
VEPLWYSIPALARTAALYRSWMDETPSSGTDIFISRLIDGGITFGKNVQVTTAPTKRDMLRR